jgi:hypothetical protein
MRIKAKRLCSQAIRLLPVLLIGLIAPCSCGGKRNETPVVPPATPALSREVIGYGVINVSYTHVTAEPEDGGASPGYLRRGSLVRVVERRTVKTGKTPESWVLVDGAYRGWLREAMVDIYDNEPQARTAAESMAR